MPVAEKGNSSGGSTPAEPVMRGKTHDLDQLVQSSRKDLREDFISIFRKYAQLNRARAEPKQLHPSGKSLPAAR